MDLKEFYVKYQEFETRAFALFKERVRKDNPSENLSFKLLSSRLEEDHFFLNILENHVFSSVGSFEKFDVKVPFACIEREDTEDIEYDRKVASGLGLF